MKHGGSLSGRFAWSVERTDTDRNGRLYTISLFIDHARDKLCVVITTPIPELRKIRSRL